MDDPVRGRVRVAHDVSGGEAHDIKTGCAQEAVARRVMPELVGRVVNSAVDLDDQARLDAAEVGHIGVNRMLAPEGWPARPPPSEPHPQAGFRRRQTVPQVPRPFAGEDPGGW